MFSLKCRVIKTQTATVNIEMHSQLEKCCLLSKGERLSGDICIQIGQRKITFIHLPVLVCRLPAVRQSVGSRNVLTPGCVVAERHQQHYKGILIPRSTTAQRAMHHPAGCLPGLDSKHQFLLVLAKWKWSAERTLLQRQVGEQMGNAGITSVKFLGTMADTNRFCFKNQ